MSRIQDVIFCDDVREEKSGKTTLVGVYQANLRTSNFPLQMNMSFVVRANGLPAGLHQLHVQILKDEITLHELDLEVSAASEETPIQIFFVGAPINFEKPGCLSLMLTGSSLGEPIRGSLAIEKTPIEEIS